MKLQLSGGPLDGATVEGRRIAVVPNVVEFSRRRQVFAYIRRGDGMLHHVPRAETPSTFAAWWEDHGTAAGTDRELAERAWNAALDANP